MASTVITCNIESSGMVWLALSLHATLKVQDGTANTVITCNIETLKDQNWYSLQSHQMQHCQVTLSLTSW